MLPHCSASVEFETGQNVHHHPLHRWQTFRTWSGHFALTEAQTQADAEVEAEVVLWAVSGQRELWLPHFYRRSGEAFPEHGVTATSTGHAAREAQYKNNCSRGATFKSNSGVTITLQEWSTKDCFYLFLLGGWGPSWRLSYLRHSQRPNTTPGNLTHCVMDRSTRWMIINNWADCNCNEHIISQALITIIASNCIVNNWELMTILRCSSACGCCTQAVFQN